MRSVVFAFCCSAVLLSGAVTISIKYPVAGQELGMIAEASGSASTTTGTIVSVETRIDGGAWVKASTAWILLFTRKI